LYSKGVFFTTPFNRSAAASKSSWFFVMVSILVLRHFK
jgi:hypothetical protein